MSIISLLEQIRSKEIVLPAIQRNFVWSERKISKLCDSIMRGYPIGIILQWETYNDIQYRYFKEEYQQDPLFTFHENPKNKRLKLVLDGQQRLQSLYIALYGTYDGKSLYFDVLSGKESEDFKEDKFIFSFMNNIEAKKNNENAVSVSQEEKDNTIENNGLSYFLKIKDLISSGAKDKQVKKKQIIKLFDLSEDDENRLEMNLATLQDVLTSEGNILKATTIDENKPSNSPDRKSESDVLEAFVRINREGTPLSRSDLIFSMLKLNWKESAYTLPEFVQEINEGNSFEFDADFIIRCLFVVSDLGSKFDIDILRKKTNVRKIQTNFGKCCDSIRSAVDFIQNSCWISSSKLLGGYYNLVPFVYYLFHCKNHQVPEDQIDRAIKSLYLLGFTSPFSRYADSRLNKYIREELKPISGKPEKIFPYEETIYWVWYWEKIEEFGPALIQGNPLLAMHLVQRKTGAKVHYPKNNPQMDHIFPRSVLRKSGKYEEAEINHFGNFWILEQQKNQNKSNKHPKDFLRNISDSILKRALIDRKMLNYNRYRTFIKTRSEKMLDHIRTKLNLKSDDYKITAHYDLE
jgi:5-methylcytosine-specific restriction endonuclease McrA